jgi:hypothetical protein
MGSYRERLFVPVSYWLLAIPVVVLLGGEAYFIAGGIVPPLTMAVIAAVVGAFLVNWGSATIEVAGGVLRVGRKTLALSEAGEVIALDERQSALLRGPRADPAAHLLLRPYLKRAVYVGIADQAEGIPYWLVATRRPAELAAAIERSLTGSGDESGDRESVG